MILKEETHLYSKADLYRKDYETWRMHKEIVPQSVKIYTTFEIAFKKKRRGWLQFLNSTVMPSISP